MTDSNFADYQTGIYMAGLAGQLPELPISIEELEAAARDELAPAAYDYVAGSAGSEVTARDNLRAFDRWQLLPRQMRAVEERDHAVEILGTSTAAPVMLAPVGMLGAVHEEAEIAVGRAAAALKLPMVLSTVSSRSMEQVADAMGDAPRWFQLYWPRSEAVTRSLLGRAEAAGYSAIVLTVDTRAMAWRERDLQRAYLPALEGDGLANYFTDPAFAEELGCSPADNPQAAVLHWARNMGTLSHTWEDFGTLREMTSLPIVLKGILHPADARLALEHGADGIVVSNHGGRQVDGAVAALDALPSVVAAVDGGAPVLFDSGIRRGADIVKALALGAEAVLVGRPWVWGLALAGRDGVKTVLQRILADYDLTMMMTGYTRPGQLSTNAVVERPSAAGA
jgi:isopentenyl diphosphate isomerase/L-lactate dehydrogenase-like FMN-dependent dehydrogenase